MRVTDTTYTTDLNISNTTAWGILYTDSSKSILTTNGGTSGYLLQANGAAAPSWIKATSDKTNNTIVKRDSNGGFSAGSIAIDFLHIANTGGEYASIYSNNVQAGALSLTTRGTTSTGGLITLTLGNPLSSTTAENASGRIILYSSSTAAHILKGTVTANDYTHTLPNSTGWVAIGGNGSSTGVGGADQIVYLSTTGILTAGTSATNSNTASTIVKRDSSGNFSAGTIASLLTSNRTTTGDYITIQSNGTAVGKISLNTRGTTSAEGWVSLTLGNASAATVAENASGRIYLYSRNTSLQIEAAYGAFNSSVTGTGTGSIYYLNFYENIYAQSNILGSHYGLIQSNNTKARYGDFEITTSGTTSVEGKASLKLGNARAKGTAENATGQILLYHSDGGASTISAAFDSIATTTKAVKIDTGLSVVNSIETTTGYLYVRAGSIWAGTTASTTAERDVGARAGSGNLYLYATAATTGNRGLQGTNAAGTNTAILTIDQSNQISAMATIACSPVLTATSAFTKAGQSVALIKGRDTAIIKTTSYSGYNAAFSLKTTAGDWSFGVYSNNCAYLIYASDTCYSSNTNTWGGQIEFSADGNIVTNGLIGSIGAGERYCEAQNSTYGNRICLDVTANGQTAGIWSSGYVNGSGTYTAGTKWLIYRNMNNAVVVGDTLWTEGNMYVGSTGQGTLQAGNVRYTSLTNYSSLKVKENIYPISDNDALSLLYINPVYFNYKKGYGSQEKTIGVIAEEVERFVRYIVTESEDPIHPTLKLKGVSYDKFIPYLIKLAQIQQREITNLKSQIQEYMESNAQN